MRALVFLLVTGTLIPLAGQTTARRRLGPNTFPPEIMPPAEVKPARKCATRLRFVTMPGDVRTVVVEPGCPVPARVFPRLMPRPLTAPR